ncbi:hypothetical protein ACOZDF_30225 [Streptomyces griseoincarnatus]
MPIRAENTSTYSRSAIKHWTDVDKDGCDACAEVLLAEAVVTPEPGAHCKLSGGQGYSAYDDTLVDGSSGMDADHRVPFGEVWQSGSHEWGAAERQVYVNDLEDPRSLIASHRQVEPIQGQEGPGQVAAAISGQRL